MITSEFPPKFGGTGNYVYNISRKLIEKGYQVSLITRGSVNKTRKEVVDGIEVLRAPFIPIYPFHVSVHGIFVNRLVKSLEPKLTLVHLHIPFPPLIKTALPIITTVHTPMKIDASQYERFNLYSIAERLQSRIAYPLELKLLKSSDRITTVSRSVAQELKEYGLDPDEIIVVGNGVDEKIFTPPRNERCENRYILYTGRLGFRKGLFDFIRCGARVCQAYPDIKFVITGKGPLLGKLKEEVRKIGLQGKIKFLGYVEKNKLIQLYQNATIYVVPSHYEGLPTVLLEAMSCGLPVVATAVSGNTEVISSGANGLLVSPKAPEEMAKTISRLLDDEDLRKKIGRAARKTIEKRYTLNKISENILKCYRSVI